MNKPANSHRWFTGWRAAARQTQDDPADLGTAFGLDLSMAMPEDPPAPLAPKRAPGWMQRLAARRKPAV
jgi:hypothetical protein